MDGPPKYHIAFPNLPHNCRPWQNELQGNYRGFPKQFLAPPGANWRANFLVPRAQLGFGQRPRFELPLRQAPPRVQQYLDINTNERSTGNHDRANKGISLLQSQLCCHACKMFFKDIVKLDDHLTNHIKCVFPNCSFFATRKVLKNHEIQCHRNTKSQLILDTPEQISKWREARKRNYPTMANVTKKQEEEKQREDSGQTLQNKKFRYNKRQGWKNKRGKRGKKRNKNRKEIPLTYLLEGVTTTKENVLSVNNDKSVPVENDTKETVVNSGVLGALAAVYAASSSDEDDCDKNKEQTQSECVEKSNQESEPCQVQESEKVKLTKSNADDDEELARKKTNPNREKKTNPNRVNKKRNQRVVQNRQRPSLLKMLLAPDIRHERNIILQCLRRIVKKDFFGIDVKII